MRGEESPRLEPHERKTVRTSIVLLGLSSPFMVVLAALNELVGLIGSRVWTFVALGGAICGLLALRQLWLVDRYDSWLALSRRIRGQMSPR